MENQVIQLEHDMWEAAFHRDVDLFRSLVSTTAVMVCGGYRCLGSQYADIIPNFYISGYQITGMEVVSAGEEEVILHYILKVDVENSRDMDLAGLFHVASAWKKKDGVWNLIFNMDSRIVGQ